ncbi:uncharacterized protein LOC108001883 [Apis cerana]|uniref:High mobility group B protein 4-like n=2 Tax=Apis TaxID=7459 RepID=A0A7M7H1K6_APIME|nr:high mobility group B protein 4-like [Apis mellifera]XP_016918647.1 uncharacterized protein LOC108001883 [Apis cerana]KAG6795632.1 high mobility group B protein 4-like [Apis mellifera caucasica]KAG9432979.1 high mobility group B protein 4-like [Apis mellifera carnica]PBC28433.1 High mobility group B protein [Apis cerana cerana]|eukprot:XP_006568497.1 high mobility group B protein 4-like [Apis mellifera]
MDKNINQEKNCDGSNEENFKDGEYNTSKQIKKIIESKSNSKLKSNSLNQRAHSRSRSPYKSSRHWSSNAFINFVQDFRQNYDGVKSSRIFQMAGERWKKMSSDEKQPYLKAAMDIRNKKQNQQKTENTYKIENINIEQPKNDDSQKQEKPGKKEKKKKEPKRPNKNKNYTESDTDSITSGCSTDTNTSDISDMSS